MNMQVHVHHRLATIYSIIALVGAITLMLYAMFV